MATRRLSIDLSLRENFQALPYAASKVDPSVELKPQPIVPKVLWAMNVLATDNGVRAASFALEPVSPIPTPANLNSALYKQVEVIDSAGNMSYMLLDDTPGPTGERIYYLLTADKQWTRFVSDVYVSDIYFPVKYTMFQTRTIVLWTFGDVIDPAWTVVNPTTNRAFIEFNLVNKTATFHELLGGDQFGPSWIGVASWGNYMLTYTLERIYWSNPLNFADFVPTEGGAGSARISEAQGPILLVVPCSAGLIIYCRRNIVMATYSGDPLNPWIFSEVPGSSGIIIYEGEPLVTRDEQSPFQVAMTGAGLQFVSPGGAEAAPEPLTRALALEYTEVKPVGSAKISRFYYPSSDSNQYRYNKIKRIDLFGNKLFFLIGQLAPAAGQENTNRLLMFNLQTGETAWIEGDIRSVVPTLDLNLEMTPGRDQHKKLAPITDSYILTKRVIVAGQPSNRNIILDFVNTTTDLTVATGAFVFRDPEIMFSNLQIRRGSRTILYAVRLQGVFSNSFEEEEVDLNSVVKVAVYTEDTNHQTPTIFTYDPGSKSFVGEANGAELRVIISGKNFKLFEVEFEVALGGD